MTIKFEQDDHIVTFELGDATLKTVMEVVEKELRRYFYTEQPTWQEIEQQYLVTLEPDVLFSAEDEAYEYFKDGTKEELEAAIKRFKQVEWFNVCGKLKKLLDEK